MSSDTVANKLPSNRSVGMVFVVLFLAIALYPMIDSRPVHAWAIVVAVLMGVVALLFPDWLTPLARAWMWLGELLHRVVNPVVVGVIFFLLITPVALAMRAAKRDILRLRRDRTSKSYWIERDPPGPPRSSFPNQF